MDDEVLDQLLLLGGGDEVQDLATDIAVSLLDVVL